MKWIAFSFVLGFLLLFVRVPEAVPAGEGGLDEIVKQIEKRYDVPGFTSDFHQISTIKAMDIADEAMVYYYFRQYFLPFRITLLP